MKKRILLIEDDIKLIKYMEEYLTAYDYSIQTIKDFDNIQEEISNAKSDLRFYAEAEINAEGETLYKFKGVNFDSH